MPSDHNPRPVIPMASARLRRHIADQERREQERENHQHGKCPRCGFEGYSDDHGECPRC